MGDEHSTELIEPSWDLLRRLFTTTQRSSAWRDTGLWAVDRLEDHLGHAWARKVLTSSDPLRSRIALAATHTQAFASLLELAVRLELTVSLQGQPTLVKDLRRDRRLARFVHSEIVLEMVTVSDSLGVVAAIEVAERRNPVDVVLEWDSLVPVEATTLFTDFEFRRTDDATRKLHDAVLDISIQTGAQVTLDLVSIPRDQSAVCDLVRRLIGEASRDGVAQLGTEFGTIGVSVRNGFAPPTMSGPVVSRDGWKRTGSKLTSKAHKEYSERPVWLRVDVLDGLWQFTNWAEMDLESKLSAVAAKVHGDLAGSSSVAGVVLSSGAVRNPGGFIDELVRNASTKAIGLRRLLPFSRVRETMIVPVEAAHVEETQLWISLYDSEPEWFGLSLDRLDLPDQSSILG